MGGSSLAAPTAYDLLRLPLDPEFAREAVKRWGIEALLYPTCFNCTPDDPQPRPRLFRRRGRGCSDDLERIPFAELDLDMQTRLRRAEIAWP